MPRGDRTGPQGMGSRSGRGMGFCSGYGQPGYVNSGSVGRFGQGGGRGFGGGGGFGGGRTVGWGNPHFMAAPGMMPAPVYSKETEKGYLENEISSMKSHLVTLEERLKVVQEED